MHLFSSLLALITFSILTGACHKESSSSSKIVNGRPVTTTSPAYKTAVAIASNEAGVICSGTLIAPNLVVTAAHCVIDENGLAKPASEFSAIFGEDVEKEATIKVLVSELQIYKPNSFGFFPNFDVAWLKLEENAPARYEPMEILRSSKPLSKDTSLLLAGYGRTKTGCLENEADCKGKLLEAETKIHRYIDTSRYFSLIHVTSQLNQGSCNGDSGGPAYIQKDGRWYLVGATNGINPLLTPKALTDASKQCESGESLYTFLGDYVAWIEASSGINLAYDAKTNPVSKKLPLQDSSVLKSAKSIEDFLNYNNHNDPIWITVGSLMDVVAFQAYSSSEERIETLLSSRKTAETLESLSEIVLVPYGGETLRDISPLAYLKSLKSLELYGTQAGDLSPIKSLTKLEALILRGSYLQPMADLSFLSSLTKLRSLTVVEIDGWDPNLMPWESLTKLKTLDLSGNPIGAELASIPWDRYLSLKELYLNDAEISDFSPLARLPKLSYLELDSNPVEDFSPLLEMKNLKEILAAFPEDEEELKGLCPKTMQCSYGA